MSRQDGRLALRRRLEEADKTQMPIKETGFFCPTQHIYIVFFYSILHSRSHGARNPGGLPRSMVSCFESRNREASDFPLEALL